MTARLRVGTPSLDESRDFYERAGFQIDDLGDSEFVARERGIEIEVDASPTTRSTVVVEESNPSEIRGKLQEFGPTLDVEDSNGGFEVADPNGVRVLVRPPVTSDAGAAPACRLGNSYGVSIEAFDAERSAAFWSAVGYTASGGDPAAGYQSFSRAGSPDVTLLGPRSCPHLFSSPGLNFFNHGENLKVIAELEKAGVPIAERITRFNDEGLVDNVVVRDPAGLTFFVFND